MIRKSSALLAMAIIFMMCLPVTPQNVEAAGSGAAESDLLDVRLDGPSFIGAEQNESFIIRVSYAYPERILNYSFKASVIGSDAYGASISPSNGTSLNGTFVVGITGKYQEGKMTVQINASASEATKTWYTVEEFEIDVVTPIRVFGLVQNSGTMTLNNVSVSMYIDGEFIESKLYTIAANTSITIYFNWSSMNTAPGRHVAKLVIDSPSDIVEFSEGNNVMEIEFYFSEPGNWLRGILVISIIFVAVFLVLTILQKKRMQKT